MFIDAAKYVSEKTKEERQSHLKLEEDCWERGGNSTNHRGVLAQYLNTNIPKGRIIMAHACGNSKCSNPRHLYWGTDRENIIEDGTAFGTYISIWERSVAKYGIEGARKMNRRGDKSVAGKGNKGKPKSLEHRMKISEGLRNRNK